TSTNSERPRCPSFWVDRTMFGIPQRWVSRRTAASFAGRIYCDLTSGIVAIEKYRIPKVTHPPLQRKL
ncbi:MAG: hypothetical protein QF516_06940, partial [Pirellulaceae bacterium]|nr:hypothetical protein [Pirellulaceae bacterium]